VGGSALGPRTFAAVIATLAEADASAAMVYLMHMCATATIAAARPDALVEQTLKDISAGRHLTTLAFSEAGSRSHFWAPVSRANRNGAKVRITAKKSWVTSAGHAQSYVVSALAPEGQSPTDSTLYLFASGASGMSIAGPWDGLGMRANASAPMILEDCEVEPGLQVADDGGGVESKASAGDVAIAVTSAAMRACGGAAFSKHLSIERLFRDAHAGAVMAPTGDVLREFIGKAVLGIPLF